MLRPLDQQLERYRGIVFAPVVTEKSMRESELENKYTFKVHPDATKIDVKRAIEAMFDVQVVSVNTMNMPGKERRRSYRYRAGKTAQWKKAIVTLAPGSSIDVIERG